MAIMKDANSIRQTSILLFAALLLTVHACSSTPKPAPKPPSQKPSTKVKPIAKPVSPIEKEGQKQGQAVGEERTDLQKALIAALTPSIAVLGSDVSKIRSFQPIEPRSVEEALAVVISLRFVANTEKARSYQVRDISEGNTANVNTNTNSPNPSRLANSFTQLIQPIGIQLDPMRALRTNPFLQSTRVYQYAVAAAKLLQPQCEDRRNLQNLLLAKVNRFNSLLGNFSKISATDSSEEVDSMPEPKPTDSSPKFAVDQYSLGDLRRGDALLSQASQLANQGRFQEAIDLTQQISPNDPFYDASQQKIREFSNLAVQNLRQKAAQAFQNSLPVSDPDAKAAYLKEARQYLQEALQNYPSADQLGTVQQNLETISRDLESLNQNSNESG